jgi:hypothetical protein
MIWLTMQVVESLRKFLFIEFPEMGRNLSKLSLQDLEGIPLLEVKGDFVYAWDGKDLYKLALFDRNFYRLRMLAGKPILEIDGLRMHLTKEFRDVFEYSKEIVRLLKIGKGDTVLDIGTGLGYTAIAAFRLAKKVVTIEKSPASLQLAKWNPWSRELFSSPNIDIINGDAFEQLPKLKQEFTKIIHDPPRLSLAGHLYSSEFYRMLRSSSREGALMFHYFGSLGKGRRSIPTEVKKRLSASGWGFLRHIPRLQGSLAKAQ